MELNPARYLPPNANNFSLESSGSTIPTADAPHRQDPGKSAPLLQVSNFKCSIDETVFTCFSNVVAFIRAEVALNM